MTEPPQTPMFARTTSEDFIEETVLAEAERLVGKDRDQSYGHPYDNHVRIAGFWSAILGVHVTPRQVAMCMVALKISRDIHRPKRDNLVDIAGYVRCIDRFDEVE